MTSDPSDPPGGFDWQHYERELTEPAPVDSPEAQRPARFTLAALRTGQRRPIVPGWLKSKSELLATLRWFLGYAWHASRYHAVRIPKYTLKLAIRTPRGLCRIVVRAVRWSFDLEGEPMRQYSVRVEDADLYIRLSRQRDRRVRWRGMVAVGATVCLVVAAGWLAIADPTVRIAILLTLLGVSGMAGAPADKPLLDTAVVKASVQPLTSDVVVRALSALGIAGIAQALSKNPKAIGFPAPIVRDGPGWRADIELPYGVTATEVIERREKLAAGLARPLGCVWPEGNAEVHPGRLILWVGDQDMAKARKPVWPLLRSGTVDLFKPVAWGTDQRGRWVELTLMYVAMLIGSIPRMGKTFALRLVLLVAALDPRARLYAFDLKGTGDLAPLEPVAHRYRAGDDEDDIDYAVAAMRELRTELRRRTKVIRDLPRDLCPESKVTAQLAGNRSLGLFPIVVGVDECQVWFEHPRYGAELEEICTDVVKRGPAVGIVLVLATQRPDAKSLPTGISANASIRFCLKVMGQTENDMVLGTSRYKQGVRATMFAWTDKGIGYFVGEGTDARIVSTSYVDAAMADAVVARARAARDAAGMLSGHALGGGPASASPGYDLLADVLAVIGPAEAKVWNETIVARLAELRPAVYADWDPEQLTLALKPYGVAVGQVWGTDPTTGKGANRRGITRLHVAAAVAERDGRPRAA
jgi:S-DNA-T family DNA segregation ATPase FtsK/SpoIIIE